MNVFVSFRHKLEQLLYRSGFASAVVRRFLCTQLIICGLGLIIGAAAYPFTLWPLTFAAGVAIATFSFWHIARFVQGSIFHQFSAMLAVKLFLGFTGRFIVISAALFALIVWLRAPIIPLLIGLTSTIAGIAAWGISRYSRKTAKEA